MVLKLDGNSKHVAIMCKEIGNSYNIFKNTTALDLNKYLKHIKCPISLHTCAPIAEIPSYTSTKMPTVVPRPWKPQLRIRVNIERIRIRPFKKPVSDPTKMSVYL